MAGKWKIGRCKCSNHMHQESLFEATDGKTNQTIWLCAKCMSEKYGSRWNRTT
ncbi:MAG: hypothetical protein Q7O66_16775 [Dehalococcoidia bacterium]|nr:hypothetical protein [Dehalococcoidia bacterium]